MIERRSKTRIAFLTLFANEIRFFQTAANEKTARSSNWRMSVHYDTLFRCGDQLFAL